MKYCCESIPDLALKMQELYWKTLVSVQSCDINKIREELFKKESALKSHINKLHIGSDTQYGSLLKNYVDSINSMKVQYNELHQHVNEKMMIFIVGNGNAGKSTLLNALVGADIAKTDELPNTWKIDVYSPDVEVGKAEIHYINGEIKYVTEIEAKRIIDEEEIKTKEGKDKFNYYDKKRDQKVSY